MPLFEYVCSECGAKFDELVSRADDTVQCPSCHSHNTEKQLSVFAASVVGAAGAPACARPSCPGGGFS